MTYAHATLIDCDNIGATYWPLIKSVIPNNSKVLGCGTKHALPKWRGVKPSATFIKVDSGKNQADILISIQAMQLFYEGVRHFLVCSSDADLKLIVKTLQNKGAIVDRLFYERVLRLNQQNGTTRHLWMNEQQDQIIHHPNTTEEALRFQTLALYQSLLQNGAMEDWVGISEVGRTFSHLIPKEELKGMSFMQRLKTLDCVELREIRPTIFEARLTGILKLRVPALQQPT